MSQKRRVVKCRSQLSMSRSIRAYATANDSGKVTHNYSGVYLVMISNILIYLFQTKRESGHEDDDSHNQIVQKRLKVVELWNDGTVWNIWNQLA